MQGERPEVVRTGNTGRAAERRDKRRRVLVIADDPRVQEAIRVLTMLEGCDARVVVHGPDATETIRSLVPDAILVELPQLGPQVELLIRRYRAVAPPRVPIILVTEERLPADRVAGIGAAGALPKPFAVAELLDLLDDLVGCD